MIETRFSSRILRRFVEAVSTELGNDQFKTMLSLSNLPAELATPETYLRMDPAEAANTYASLQTALRAYYGRGARGVLLRVGQRLWDRILNDSALFSRAQAVLIKRLPFATSRKSILELLARSVAAQPGDVTVHNLDLDLLLIDHVSPAAEGQHESSPICYVTQGLIRESLLWATGQGFDVEEIACKATGQQACEFKITTVKAV
ncbi:MAG TPA: V4R domain-containing protein [Anaerolineales bacterium]|nr:V4R domain-containing protein [Anaerolineales bacterium]